VVCDGAKESCPSRIATGIDTAFQALYLAKERQVFSHGCGIVENCIEATIANIGRLGREGMKETDKVVLDIMTHISN
jgi:L-cysteine desulfidase